MNIIILGISLAAVFFIWRAQARTYIIQYLYFLRVPLVIAVAMVILPFFAGDDSPKIIQNWFELDMPGIFMITWLSIYLAWTVMHMTGMLYINIPFRNDLPLRRSDHEIIKKTGMAVHNPMPEYLRLNRYRLPLFSLLAGHIIYRCIARSQMSMFRELLAVTLGIVFALSFVILTWWIQTYYKKRTPGKNKSARAGYSTVMEKLTIPILGAEGQRALRKGYDVEHDSAFTRRSAGIFLILTLCLYLLGLGALKPDSGLQDYIPAFAYVLILLTLITVFLSRLTLRLDKFRVPLLSALIVIGSIGYTESGKDHFYSAPPAVRLEQIERGDNAEILQAFENWSRLHPVDQYPAAIVVAASGGGITASQWSAQVLANLFEETGYDRRVVESIVAVSSVSGGAVGTMYFVDSFSPDRPPDAKDMHGVVNMAGRSSLGAVGWGLAYPDFLRNIGASIMRGYDRGWAIERRWGAANAIEEATLRSWREGALEGWRPVMFFNATITETGDRFVMSPLRIPSCDHCMPRWHAKNFIELYPENDIKIVTAARLSATFPFVTPISRPDIGKPWPAYHIADGGYYDNFGVMSALEYLQTIYPVLKASDRKVILVEVRASNPYKQSKPPGGAGYFFKFTGPLKTLLSVRTPSQVMRNDEMVRSLQTEWDEVNLESVIFTLDQEAPLSWHLSVSDKVDITDGWCSQENLEQLNQFRKLSGLMEGGDGRELSSVLCSGPDDPKESYMRSFVEGYGDPETE